MSVLQSLILVLALAAPLSALTCQQCLYYDDTDATDTQKAIITGIQTAQATTKCGTNQTAEACDDSTMDACFSTVLKSKLGGNTTMYMTVRACGLASTKDTACTGYTGIAQAINVTIDSCLNSMCEKDGCNSGTTLTASLLMLTAFLAWFTL